MFYEIISLSYETVSIHPAVSIHPVWRYLVKKMNISKCVFCVSGHSEYFSKTCYEIGIRVVPPITSPSFFEVKLLSDQIMYISYQIPSQFRVFLACQTFYQISLWVIFIRPLHCTLNFYQSIFLSDRFVEKNWPLPD